MKIKDGLVLRKVAGQYVIVPTGSRVKEIHGVLYISHTAKYLWDYMQNNDFQKEDLVNLAKNHFTGVTEEQLEKDISQYLKDLADHNILDDGIERGYVTVRWKKKVKE